jgi:acetoin utilization deacetylase AcuC-like enzyme
VAYFVYSDKYYLEWPGHVFPIEKYKLLYDKLQSDGIITKKNILEPAPATDEDILLVHTKRYLDHVKDITDDPMLALMEFEVPVSTSIVEAFYCATGGTILASRIALEKKTAVMNLGGGFHHAFSDHGEGFCLINDLAVAIRVMQKEKLLKKVLVVDLDLHQGNGTAHIFLDDPDIFTFSMHQENNYPIKQKSSLDIGLADFTADSEYLKILEENISNIIKKHKPELILYQAGADSFEGDLLGTLRLTKDGLKKRDEIVIKNAYKNHIPIAVTLGGGYAPNINDVVDIHAQTAKVVLAY